MSKYADIIARLEKATGPSRDMDRAALKALGYTWRGMAYWHSDNKRMWEGSGFLTCTLDASVNVLNQMLPGWGWRGGSCHLSDDCFVFPDYNCPTHGERLKREFNVKIDGKEWSDYTDIDLRPAGRLPIAILMSIFTALDGVEKIKGMRHEKA